MSDQQQPGGGNHGDITISGSIGSYNVVGHGNIQINKDIYQNSQPTIDIVALKSTLMELYTQLGAIGLPPEKQMDAQSVTNQVRKDLESQTPKTEEIVGHLKEIGDTIQTADTTIQQGSNLANTILNVATIAGPLVVGGAHLIASWFGLLL